MASTSLVTIPHLLSCLMIYIIKINTKLTLRAIGKKVNPRSSYRVFVPKIFVKLNR
jgi:hypothetical protein